MGYLELVQSNTMESFAPFLLSWVERLFQLKFPIILFLIDAPLYDKIALGLSWFDAMTTIMSSVVRVLRFPYEDKVVSIDQLVDCTSDSRTNAVPIFHLSVIPTVLLTVLVLGYLKIHL